MFALDDEQGLIAQRTGGGRIRVYVALKTSEDWVVSDIIASGGDEAGHYLLNLFSDWDDVLRTLIADSDDRLVPRPIYALPVGHRWDRVAGVTLLGDAAHLMSPFAGAGANLAMLDGAELARAIAEHDDLDVALTAYETALFTRSEAAAAESAENLIAFFQPNALQTMIERFAAMEAGTASEMDADERTEPASR